MKPMKIETEVVREILKGLYIPMPNPVLDEPVLAPTHDLSPPSIGGLDDLARRNGYEHPSVMLLDHIDLLEACGLVQRTQKIKFRDGRHNPVTIEPTDATLEWARFAFSDEQWEASRERLEQILSEYH
jgi:hypothetical protein